LKVIAHSGPWRAGTAKQIEGHDVVLTSYDTVVQDYAMLKTINWNVIVLDEAQAIKNPAAKRSLKSKALPRSFGLVVTGTPLENRLLDLWSLTQFADPSRFDSQDSFELNYTDSPESAARVHAMIRPILLRRKLDDIEHQLPEKTIINHPLKWPDELNDIYEDTRSAAIAEYRRSGSLVAVSRLRKLATHPILMDIGPRDLTALSPKYTVTISILEELFLNNEKALVFMTYVRMIDLVAEDLESRFENVLVLKMYGRVPMEERSRLIDRFNMHRGPAVMLCNTIVAGAGLNITGANHVIHFNLEWNPAKEDQATFRVYRHGQTLKTFIHRLFYLDTVDEVIDQRIAMKRELADMSVDARLTSEDIRSWLMVSPNGASSA
jgi:SNF2 family DNA or RNA helicase